MAAVVEERDNRDILKAEYQAVSAHLGFTVNLRFVTFGAFLAANGFLITAYGRGETIEIFPRYLLALVSLLTNCGLFLLELRTTRSHRRCMDRGCEIEEALSLDKGIYSRLNQRDDTKVGYPKGVWVCGLIARTMTHARILKSFYAAGILLWLVLLILAALGWQGKAITATSPGDIQNILDKARAVSKQDVETRLAKTDQELQDLGRRLMAVDKRIDSQTRESSESAWIPPFTALAIIGGVGGFLLVALSRSRGTRALGAIVGTLSILGGGAITVFKISDLKLTWDFHLPGITVTSSRSGSGPTFRFLGHVGPFETGFRDRLEDFAASKIADSSCQCGRVKEISEALQIRPEKKQLTFLLVIGSADKFELGGRLRRTYGSNEGLARARAEWLRDQLVDSKTLSVEQASKTLMLTVGPSIHGERLSAKDTRPDRRVTVFGVWLEDSPRATLSADAGGVEDEPVKSGVSESSF